ncbi:MAG: MATE family efflux transporter [Sneathiellaceae bacterium]
MVDRAAAPLAAPRKDLPLGSGGPLADPRGPWLREIAATWSLGLPLALSQLAWIGLTVTDVLVLGWYSPTALAAGGLGANYFFLPYIFGLGVLAAVSPIVAQRLGQGGAGQLRSVRRAVRQGLWVAIALAVPATLFCLAAGPAFRAMGQDPAIGAEATRYIHAAMPGLLPAFGIAALRGFMSSLSRGRPVLLVSLGALPVNLVLDYALVFGAWGLPELGVVGAGLTSAAVEVAMLAALIGLVVTDRQFRRYAIFGRFWRSDWAMFRQVLAVGCPIGVTLLLEVGVFSAGAFLMGFFGTTALAAHQIAIQCAAVTFMIPFGLSQATTVRVGLSAGRRDGAGALRAGLVGTFSALIVMAGAACLFWVLGPQIAALFVDLSAPGAREVASLAAGYLAIAAVFQLVDGAQVAANGALRGLKDTQVPMAIVAVGYWLVAFPLALLLGFELGWRGEGLWWALAVGLAFAAVTLTARFLVRLRRFGRQWAAETGGP